MRTGRVRGVSMSSPASPVFVHRENREGTIDSICRACYVTVGTSAWEADLERAEKDHVCDPSLVAHWNMVAGRNQPRS